MCVCVYRAWYPSLFYTNQTSKRQPLVILAVILNTENMLTAIKLYITDT